MTPDEDLEFEAESNEEESRLIGGDLKKLRNKLKEAESKAAEYLAGWQRAKADYVNFQRETEENRRELLAHAKKPLLLELIHLADTFDLAFSHEESLKGVPENWRLGVEHIHKELIKILEGNGLTVIDPLGQTFNPVEQHSVGGLETDDLNQDNRVVQVLKKGYKLGETIIRPAQVKINIYGKNSRD